MRQWIKMGTLSMVILFPAVTFATESTGMPWEEPMQVIIDSLTGPFLRSAIILCFLITGLSLAYGENNGGFIRNCLRTLLGLAVAVGATSWGLEIIGFPGGLLF